ncbi:unnamed protein product [Adineta steineri]|uniref:Peptidase S1 domain-containing protein n=1 Tax=Adineta steineri TaxID=433720 RepID=A0A813SSQ5_9BILA|nr:unnamed protein product [Adineta steineri]
MLFLPVLLVIVATAKVACEHEYACNIRASCGCSTRLTVLAKIVGGEPAQPRSWSWIVSLFDHPTNKYFCAASIISNVWVLTAAHCFIRRDHSDIIVHAGSNQLNDSTQHRHIAKIIVHPEFNQHTFVADIALIQLTSPLDMTDLSIAKICLPAIRDTIPDENEPTIDMNEYPPVNSAVVAVGWGQLAENDRSPSRELQQVTLKAIPYESKTCEDMIFDRSVQFCAGDEMGGKGTSIQ